LHFDLFGSSALVQVICLLLTQLIRRLQRPNCVRAAVWVNTICIGVAPA